MFTVFGDPIPQPRQRHRVVIPKVGKPFATSYTPENDPVQGWKKLIQKEAQLRMAQHIGLFVGPVLVDIVFFLPRPQYMMTKKYPDGRIYHASRGDADNLEKAVFDALNKLVYDDDGQICDHRSVKYYAEKTGKSRAEILIQELT